MVSNYTNSLSMATNLMLSLITLILSPSSVLFTSSTFLCTEQDYITLLKIKETFSDSPSVATWNKSTDCCTWENTACNNDGTINYLNIYNSKFSGPITESIGDLTTLIDLYMVNNPNLSGEIPASFSKLTSLKSIYITNSSLSGPVPSFLCHLPMLYYIDFTANRLTGSIPSCFGSKFAAIRLGQNQLSGSIPPFILHGKTIFSGLIVLDLNENQLTGEIPRSLKNVEFDTINLSGNRLSGDASFLFGTLKTTKHIDLSRNELEFDISNVKFPRLMRTLDISQNRITGRIPKQITKVQYVYGFNVSHNELCGKIPSGGVVSSFGQSSFDHNKCLCGAPLPPCNQTIGN